MINGKSYPETEETDVAGRAAVPAGDEEYEQRTIIRCICIGIALRCGGWAGAVRCGGSMKDVIVVPAQSTERRWSLRRTIRGGRCFIVTSRTIWIWDS